MLLLAVPAGAVASEDVSFPDADLEVAVRDALGKPGGDITADDMATLGALDADDRGISDLSGLEHAVNLRDLDLEDNEISDLSPLANLTALRDLDLEDNEISDLSPLVANDGLGSGDSVDVRYNNLDLTPESAVMKDIEALERRGVDVDYMPQHRR
ncbi:MAG: leucine-rich repeat domain-containing protein [Methanomicrobiales archaeon]|nr:leucine-rich repeat domain-containing protein [Methanomicrobiales archaeon]